MPDSTINRMFRKKKGGLLIESRIKLKNAKLEEYKQKKNSIVYLCKFNVHTNSGIIQSRQTIEFPELATSRLGKTGQYFLESMFSCWIDRMEKKMIHWKNLPRHSKFIVETLNYRHQTNLPNEYKFNLLKKQTNK